LEKEQETVRRLYLIRHAKSSWTEPDLADFDRPLSNRGKLDAPFMGKRLAAYGVRPDLILASPAKRARKTALLIAAAVGYGEKDIVFDEDIYESDVPGLLSIIAKVPARVGVLFLVGHNYAITDLADYLSGRSIGNIPTCGIVAIEFADGSWSELQAGSGRTLFFDYPKKHGRRG
jgi:phosphohistidine phosphatase